MCNQKNKKQERHTPSSRAYQEGKEESSKINYLKNPENARKRSEFMKNYNMKEEVQLRNSTLMKENNPMKNSHISKKNHENQIGKKRPQTSLALTGTVFTNERKRNISESMKRLEKIQCNICLNFYSRSNISKHQQIHKAA